MFSSINILKRGLKKSYYHLTYTPTDSIVFLTYRCTSRCASCNIWQRPVNIDEELDWNQWKLILGKLVKNGIKSVELFGGDALLRKDLLFNMIRFCTENNICTFMPTNSIGLTEEVVKELIDAGLGTIYFSLDETAELAGSVRGIKGHHDRVFEGIALVQKLRGSSNLPRIGCITTVSKVNFRILETVLQQVASAGVDEYHIRGFSEFSDKLVAESAVNGILPSPYFMSTDGQSRAYNYEEAGELLEILSRIRNQKSTYRPMFVDAMNLSGINRENLMRLTFRRQECVFATTQVVISPYGNVLPCLYYKNYHLGNLTNQDLPQIWGNQMHRQFCKKQQRNEIPLCDYCSQKIYHNGLIPSVKDVARSVAAKVVKLVG
jgi:radical SAM protein with 4Fe4S-binding SPASM domain